MSEDNFVIELGNAILNIQRTLARRKLPELKSITLHPFTVQELSLAVRGNSPYIQLEYDHIRQKNTMKIAGVEIIEKDECNHPPVRTDPREAMDDMFTFGTGLYYSRQPPEQTSVKTSDDQQLKPR